MAEGEKAESRVMVVGLRRKLDSCSRKARALADSLVSSQDLRFTFVDLLLGMVITVAQHQMILLILSRITFHSSGFRGGEGRAEDVF